MLKLSGLTLTRGSQTLLDQCDLTIFPAEKVGIIGHNGAGKSTLFSALLGALSPDQGQIEIPQSWRMSWIEQEVTEVDSSVIQFVLDGDRAILAVHQAIELAQTEGRHSDLGSLYEQLDILGGYSAESRAATVLHGLGFKQSDLSRRVGEFSGGWKMRMNLARVLCSQAELVLLDEPTNHLDIEAVLWLSDWIRSAQSTVIVISHDRDFLDDICTHSVHFHQRKLTKYTGGYSKFEQAFSQAASQTEAANKKAASELAKLQQFVDRFKAKASKAKQAQSRLKRIEKIQFTETVSRDRHLDIEFPEPQKSPDPLVVLRHADCGYGQQSKVLSDVTLEIRPGDRIGLLGANGNGKTTLVRSILGELPLLSGTLTLGKGTVAGYFAQDQIESLDPQATPLLHLQRIAPQSREQELRSYLARFGFQDEKVNQIVDGFSGGEKSRLALALLAYSKPNLLLLDEPTNHLDIDTRQSLATGLMSFEGALIMVSHDRHLLESSADVFWRVNQGAVTPFSGSLDEYSSLLRQESRDGSKLAKQEMTASVSKLSNQQRQEKVSELKRLRQQLSKLEKKLQDYQECVTKVDQALHALDYAVPDSAQKAIALNRQRQEAADAQESTENQMLELMEQMESIETEISTGN